MNGVLAKPFTKEGMLKSIKTNLAHLLKNPPEHSDESGFVVSHVPYMSAPASLKFESTSPGGNNSGWSPGPLGQGNVQGNVDQWNGMINGGPNHYGMGRSNFPSDHDSPPEKRQRLDATQSNYS